MHRKKLTKINFISSKRFKIIKFYYYLFLFEANKNSEEIHISDEK